MRPLLLHTLSICSLVLCAAASVAHATATLTWIDDWQPVDISDNGRVIVGIQNDQAVLVVEAREHSGP